MRYKRVHQSLGKRPAAEEEHNPRKRSRNNLNIIDKGVNGGRKQRRKKSDIAGKSFATMDWISQLPDPILHCILSNLPTEDSARTSILSKRWKHIWDSFPILDFDQSYFQVHEGVKHGCFKQKTPEIREKREQFQNFVDSSLQDCRERRCPLEKFRLYMNSYDVDLLPHMDRWVGVATESNVKQLEICVQVKKYKRYKLPQTVFSAKTITGLSLNGCKLESCNDVELPSLQKLSLKNLHVDEQKIKNMILSCPLIEDLRLISCSGFNILKVSTLLNLNRVEVYFCHGLNKIDIEAANLHTFCYFGKKSMPCEINLCTCESLKRLTLEDANMRDDLFQNHISKFPILEQLILSKCNRLEKIKITNHRLKGLALRGCKKLVDADIDTPNLLSFEYGGSDDKMPFSSMDPSGLQEAKLSFVTREKSKLDFYLAKLEGFIKKINYSRGLKLVIRSRKNVVIYEDCKDIRLPPASDLKIEIIKSSTSYEDLVESLLRTHHPENLCFMLPSSDENLKLIKKKIMEREVEPKCCRYYSKKCWLHYLKDVTIGNIEAPEDDEMTSRWKSWLKQARSSPRTNFRLSWRFFD